MKKVALKAALLNIPYRSQAGEKGGFNHLNLFRV
jgi:hypothetical protein